MQVLENSQQKAITIYGNFKEPLDIPYPNAILLDTNIMLPLTLPKNNRNARNFLVLKNNIFSKKHNKQYKRSGGKVLAKEKRNFEKRVKIANALENGYFKKLGMVPTLTNKIYHELKYFERMSGTRNIDSTLNIIGDGLLSIFIPNNHYRKKYPFISKHLNEEGDFSLAAASIEMGCPFATDDYKSFDSVLGKIKKEQKNIWPRANFTRYDSESLAMLLGV